MGAGVCSELGQKDQTQGKQESSPVGARGSGQLIPSNSQENGGLFINLKMKHLNYSFLY